MILNFVTLDNHFNGSVIPMIDISLMQAQLKQKISALIKGRQHIYIEKILTKSLANNFYPQLTGGVPQNSTLAHWIAIEDDLRECLVLFLYCEIMEYLKTLESGVGSNMGLSNFDKSYLPSYYNEAIKIAKEIRKIVFNDSTYGTISCPCEISNLQFYPF